MEHVLVRFAVASIQTSVIIQRDVLGLTPQLRKGPEDLNVLVADDIWPAVSAVFDTYSNAGIEYVLVSRPSAYCEPDFRDLLSFHSDGGQVVTRASDPEGPLDLWVVNSNFSQQTAAEWRRGLIARDCVTDSYFVTQYVKRLVDARDVRQLVVDSFLSCCSLTPVGSRLRPGVWADGSNWGEQYLENFYRVMKDKHPDKIVVGGAWPALNDSHAAWGLNRHMDSRFGKTFEDTLSFHHRYFDAANPIPFLLIETWNDYEEGTAIERSTSTGCQKNGVIPEDVSQASESNNGCMDNAKI